MTEDTISITPAAENPIPEEDQEHINGWRAFATLGQFLQDDGWYPQPLEDKTLYRVYFNGDHSELRCYAQILIELEQLVFYVIAPVKATPEMRLATAEYLTRANYGLRIGNFELDFNDGEIRYKSSVNFKKDALTPTLIKNAIYPAVHTMDYYLPGLMSVLYGSKTAAEAIASIEG